MKRSNALRWSVVTLTVLSLIACMPKNLPLPTNVPPAITTTPASSTEAVPLATNAPTNPPPSGPVIAHLPAGQTIGITYIHMITVDEGWAIGGQNQASDHVFRSVDKGLTWHDVTPPEPAPAADTPVAALGYFKTTSTAWVAYGPTGFGTIPPEVRVWYTHDGGATWQSGSVDTSVSSEAFNPWYLTFSDDQHGWLLVFLGAGMMHNYVALFATSDGGVTWTDILDPYNDPSGIQSFSKTDMVFMDSQTGWLTRDSMGVDPSPHVFRTTNGGVAWNRIDLPTPPGLPTLFTEYSCGIYTINRFSTTSAIFAMLCKDVATYQKQLNFQYSTTDGGATWQTNRLPDGYLMNGNNDGLFYFDPNYGYALGRNIYQTTDAGATWTLIKQVTWDGQFSFVNMNVGWAVARNEGEIALVSTTNGGAKWVIINPYVTP